MKKEKKKIKKEGNSGENKKIDESESQLKWIIIGMIGVILISVLVYFIVQESKKFEYAGLEFEKNPAGIGVNYKNFDIYASKINLVNLNEEVIYTLYLRNDPRILRDINVGGEIKIMRSTILTLDPEINTLCSDNFAASARMAELLKAFGSTYRLAYTNETYAEEHEAYYLDSCNKNVSYGTIFLRKGSTNEIISEGDNCYVLQFKDCNILKVTERFIVAAIANAKGIRVVK